MKKSDNLAIKKRYQERDSLLPKYLTKIDAFVNRFGVAPDKGTVKKIDKVRSANLINVNFPSNRNSGRKEMYTSDLIRSVLLAKLEKGIPVKETCRELGIPYVSMNKAIRRYKMRIPSKGAKFNMEGR